MFLLSHYAIEFITRAMQIIFIVLPPMERQRGDRGKDIVFKDSFMMTPSNCVTAGCRNGGGKWTGQRRVYKSPLENCLLTPCSAICSGGYHHVSSPDELASLISSPVSAENSVV